MSRSFHLTACMLTALVCSGFLVARSGPPALAAQTIVVSTTHDGPCADPDGVSLRCALQTANSAGSGDVIDFTIPSVSPNKFKNNCSQSTIQGKSVLVCTIALSSALPTLTANSTIIDGYTQTGATRNRKAPKSGDNAILTIHLDGGGINSMGFGLGDGLVVTGGSDAVHGLSITNFSNGNMVYVGASGLVFSGSGATRDSVDGSFIGLTPTDAAVPNDIGVSIENGAGSDTIGGTSAALANVISANSQCTVTSASMQVDISSASANTVAGNMIGPNAANGKITTGAPCGLGIQLSNANNNTIGGAAGTAANNVSKNINQGLSLDTSTGNKVQGNTIDSNTTGIFVTGTSSGDQLTKNVITNTTFGPGGNGHGVELYNDATGVTLSSNYIGTNASGAKLGNYGYGVFVHGSSSGNTVSSNTIAFNGRQGTNDAGVMIGDSASDTATRGDVISRNSIHNNPGLGIDLAPQDVVDCATAPPGPNDYTPCPTITTATTSQVTGSSCASCTIEVFIASNESDDQGHGEGKTFLASAIANSSGSWTVAIPAGKLGHGQPVTATATTPATPGPAETSEFSLNATVS